MSRESPNFAESVHAQVTHPARAPIGTTSAQFQVQQQAQQSAQQSVQPHSLVLTESSLSSVSSAPGDDTRPKRTKRSKPLRPLPTAGNNTALPSNSFPQELPSAPQQPQPQPAPVPMFVYQTQSTMFDPPAASTVFQPHPFQGPPSLLPYPLHLSLSAVTCQAQPMFIAMAPPPYSAAPQMTQFIPPRQ